MLHFFDYVYYRACAFYNRNGEQTSYKISGLVFLSALHVLNIIFFCGLINILFQFWLNIDKYLNINKYLIIIAYFILIVLNGIRYNKLSYDILNKKWSKEDFKTQKRIDVAVIGYIILSIIAVIVLIVWRANTK